MKSPLPRFSIWPYVIVGVVVVGLLSWLAAEEYRHVSLQSDHAEAQSMQKATSSGETVNLAFGESGTIGMVNNLPGDSVAVGSVIATLDNASVRADLAEAQATLRGENVKLKNLEVNGTSSSEIRSATAQEAQAEHALLATLQAARLSTEDAIYNKSDEFFSNPNSAAPQLLFSASSTSQLSIESGRVEVGNRLLDLDTILASATTTDNLDSLSLSVKEDIAETNLFLDTAALSLNALGTSSSDNLPLIQWKSDLSAARAEVSNAISSNFFSRQRSCGFCVASIAGGGIGPVRKCCSGRVARSAGSGGSGARSGHTSRSINHVSHCRYRSEAERKAR